MPRPRLATERPVQRVPGLVLLVLGVALASQILLRLLYPASAPPPETLGSPPGTTMLRLASLGDPVPLAKAMTLYLQSFDMDTVHRIPYQRLDYARVEEWLQRILELDPDGQYPLLLASRLYAETENRDKARRMLQFIYGRFLEDPERRWPWLAHAATLAKHRLGDLELARRYAAAIQAHAKGPGVPLWARQMEIFILEDMNELEAARIMIGGFLARGQIHNPEEIRFLEGRLRDLEDRQRVSGRTRN